MFTLFDFCRVAGILGGAIAGGVYGWSIFATLGCLLGVACGLCIGGILGQLPLICGLSIVRRRFARMTEAQLRGYLHDDQCLIPNLVLLELRHRGNEIESELTFVHAMLTSESTQRRSSGLAALTSAFPEKVCRLTNYDLTGTVDACRVACARLLGSDEPGEPVNSEED